MKLDKLSFTTLSSLIITFCIICGCLWNVSFWNVFEINYFDFISTTEIIKSIIYPFASSLETIIFVFSFLLVCSIFFHSSLLIENYTNASTGSKIINESKKFLLFGGLMFLLMGVFVHLFGGSPIDFSLLYFLYSFGAAQILIRFSTFKLLFDSNRIWILFITIITFFPLFSFFQGKREAYRIKYNLKGGVVNSVFLKSNVEDSTYRGKIFIGKANDYFFFWGDSTVSYLSASEVREISLKKRKNNR